MPQARQYRTTLTTKRMSANSQMFAIGFALLTLTFCVFWFHFYYTPIVLDRFHLTHNDELQFFSTHPLKSTSPSFNLPVYYVNLDSDVKRKEFIKDQLKSWGFTDINRVKAWDEEDVRRFVNNQITSIPNLVEKNDREIGCIASHLHAMYLAVEDPDSSSPYALIVEDDISLVLDVDWKAMLDNAPPDFTILQLTTSNGEQVTKMWTQYVELLRDDAKPAALRGTETVPDSQLKPNPEHQWMLREWKSDLWSTQAYIIHKDRIKQRLSEFISLDEQSHHYYVHLKNPDRKQFRCSLWMTMCVMPFRIVADIVLYTFFPPTYMSRIPIFNGASAGMETESKEITDTIADSSESSKAKNPNEEVSGIIGNPPSGLIETSSISNSVRVAKHLKEFQRINTAITAIKYGFPHLLPSYFKPVTQQR